MIHSTTSIQEVIARVIRNTRIQDSSYIQDMNEWIPEAMGYMRTKMELKYSWADVEIEFHKGKLPCGLIHIMAVEHAGHRLKYSNTVKHFGTGHNLGYNHQTIGNQIPVFTSNIVTQNQEAYTGEGNHIWKSDVASPTTSIKAVMCTDIHPTEYYQIEMDYINTSISDTIVRIHYLSQPVDKDGFPLIPDNENYKEALYYYVRAKMIGCGYKDSVFKETELLQRFEVYAARAIGQIRYPSTDIVQSRIDNMVRFIPPQNYWENFFRTDSNEGIYPNNSGTSVGTYGVQQNIQQNDSCNTTPQQW